MSGASGVKEFTSGRVTSFNYSSNLAASDIKINGQNALAATLTSNLTTGNNTATALVTAINANSNSHGATATGFNKITSAAKSSLSMSNTFTINTNVISIQTSLENLVTEINQEASGVTASLNSDNSITLKNTTGNDIVIGGNAPTDAGFTAGTYLGYLKLTNNEGVNAVYDGVGKDTFDISLKCLKFRGLMVSFGQSSGMVNDVNLHSTFNPKSLYYTRPTLMHYIRNSEELAECSNKLFSKIKNKEIKANIFKKFKLSNASEAHELIQSRNSVGSIILCP